MVPSWFLVVPCGAVVVHLWFICGSFMVSLRFLKCDIFFAETSMALKLGTAQAQRVSEKRTHKLDTVQIRRSYKINMLLNCCLTSGLENKIVVQLLITVL